MNIGKTIRDLRAATGMKQKSLALTVGISTTYLSLIENNKMRASLTILDKIATAFHITCTELFILAIDPTILDNEDNRLAVLKMVKPIVEYFV